MERNLRDNRRHVLKQKPDPGQDFSNITLELQSQDERLAALQIQRDELLIGLQGLQESLKNQALRVTRLEGRVGEVLQQNGGGLWRMGQPLNSNITPQEYYEPRRRSQTHRRGRPGRILDSIGYSQTDNPSQSTAQNHQYQATPNEPKHSKTQKPRPQPESHPQIQVQYSNPEPQSTDYLPQPDPYNPQSQIQVRVQTRPYPIQQEQLQSRQTVPYPHAQRSQPQVHHQRHPQLRNPSHPSWPQTLPHSPTHPDLTKDKQSRTTQASGDPPQSQSESYQPRVSGWDGGEEEESVTESSVTHNFLQLPKRHKIPARPVPKKDATSK